MSKQPIFCDEAGKPGGPYTHAVRAGDFVYLAGATPNRPDGTRVEGDFVAQARATFDNLKIVAEAADASLGDAVRVGVYLRTLDNFQQMNSLYSEYLGEGTTARTTLQADLPGFEIEVDAVLYAPLSEG
ncbi:RidA family protein [Janibacter sp. GS2]|uniref:RidA family protein n=1 Tax=Janibacter sp. GS2 TaxID=3442646 RepID=UPI003EBC1A6D